MTAPADSSTATPPAAPAESGFPANTPLDQMTVEQREAYWKDKARKHEDRVRAFGKTTPEEVADLRAKAEKQDALEFELSTEADKRAADARKEAAAEADAKYLPRLVETAFRIAVGDRKTQDEITDFIGDLNLSRFLTDDGNVDTAKVRARVDQFAPDTGNQQQRPGPSSSGQGHRAPVVAKPGEAGRLAAMRRGYIPAS